MPPRVWYNKGLSGVRDALILVRQAAAGAVTTLASHTDPLAPALLEADTAFAEPEGLPRDGNHPDYVAWCLETCARRGIDLFIPHRGRTAIAGALRRFAAIGTRVSVAAPPATLRLLDDKARFYAHLSRHPELGAPRATLVRTGAELLRAVAALRAAGRQACVKPPIGIFGSGFWRLESGRSLFAQLMQPDERRIRPEIVAVALDGERGHRRLLCMEYLHGPERSIDLVADTGRVQALVARAKLPSHQRLEDEGPPVDLARSLVTHFRLSGLVNVQVRQDRFGRPRVLEINPRMSGGCRYTSFSGVNLPWVQVGVALGLITEADIPPVRAGVLVTPVNEAIATEPDPAAALTGGARRATTPRGWK